MTHTEIVKKLIGPITPLGDASRDDERFENLKSHCNLVADLILELERLIHQNKNAQEHSVKKARDYADCFLTNTLKQTI